MGVGGEVKLWVLDGGSMGEGGSLRYMEEARLSPAMHQEGTVVK